MRLKLLVFFILTMSCQICFGQRVDWRTFSFMEENDFFNIFQHGIDRFYTQGLQFEFKYTATKRKILERLVIPIPGASSNIYFVSAFQKIYTPGRTDLINYAGDHPYGGSLFVSEGLDSYDSARQIRLVSRMDAGVIGPAALAKNTQDIFHKFINNDNPVGWDTQLRNDILFNYFIRVEKALTKRDSKFRMEVKGDINAGTSLVSVVPGFNFEYGSWYSVNRKFSWQLFFRPEVRMVAFNAMLQGGILNQAYADELYSQFFIQKIKHLVYSHSTGIRLRLKGYEMLYRQVNLTREFSHQRAHYYSTIQFSFPMSKKK